MQQFNIRRIGSLIYRDIVLLKGAIVTALSVVGGILFIGSLFSLRGDHVVTANEFFRILFLLYIPLGLLFTFSIFKEAHNKKVNHFYFLLPVSPQERIAASWLTTSIIYTFVFTVFAFLVGQLAISIGSVFPDTDFHIVPIFSEDHWLLIKFYFFIQPTFLLGAITFTKNRIGKTLLLVLLAVFTLFMYNMILCFIFSGGTFDVFTSDPMSSEAFSLAENDLSGIGSVLFSIVLGPMMLLAAYFKIIEKEV